VHNLDHSRNILVKVLLAGSVIYLFLPVVGQSPPADRVTIALVTAAAGYLVGDLFVLPRWGAVTAAIVDVFIIWASIMAASAFLPSTLISSQGAFIVGVAGGIIEWFFHLYLRQAPPRVRAIGHEAREGAMRAEPDDREEGRERKS
jgi:hypothetical protein